MSKQADKEKAKTKAKDSKKHADKTRWDVYGWVGSGQIKVRESNLTLKEAKKAKEKWIKKSAKHEAFIAAHSDRAILNGLMKDTKSKSGSKTNAGSKHGSSSKTKSKSKSKSKK